MHGIIATQRVTLGETAGLAGERVIDSEESHRGGGLLEVADRAAQATAIDPSLALSGRQRRARLGVDQLT